MSQPKSLLIMAIYEPLPTLRINSSSSSHCAEKRRRVHSANIKPNSKTTNNIFRNL